MVSHLIWLGSRIRLERVGGGRRHWERWAGIWLRRSFQARLEFGLHVKGNGKQGCSMIRFSVHEVPMHFATRGGWITRQEAENSR